MSISVLLSTLFLKLHKQGWFAIRRELRIPLLVFLVLSLGYLAGWGAMFDSPTFRWTYVEWPFFGFMASASVFLTLVCFILGVVGWVNFGKGLVRYCKSRHILVLPNVDQLTHLSQ